MLISQAKLFACFAVLLGRSKQSGFPPGFSLNDSGNRDPPKQGPEPQWKARQNRRGVRRQPPAVRPSRSKCGPLLRSMPGDVHARARRSLSWYYHEPYSVHSTGLVGKRTHTAPGCRHVEQGEREADTCPRTQAPFHHNFRPSGLNKARIQLSERTRAERRRLRCHDVPVDLEPLNSRT